MSTLIIRDLDERRRSHDCLRLFIFLLRRPGRHKRPRARARHLSTDTRDVSHRRRFRFEIRTPTRHHRISLSIEHGHTARTGLRFAKTQIPNLLLPSRLLLRIEKRTGDFQAGISGFLVAQNPAISRHKATLSAISRHYRFHRFTYEKRRDRVKISGFPKNA